MSERLTREQLKARFLRLTDKDLERSEYLALWSSIGQHVESLEAENDRLRKQIAKADAYITHRESFLNATFGCTSLSDERRMIAAYRATVEQDGKDDDDE